jgi:thiamine biosynthesis lipoprotein
VSATQHWIVAHHSQRLMATPIAVHVAAPPDQQADAEDAIARCFTWFAEVGDRLTRFSTESELSELNAAGGEWRAVSEMLFAVIEQSLAAAEATGGLFDPALLPLLEALGYDRDFQAIAHRESDAEWRVAHGGIEPGGWREIELDRSGRRVRLPPGVRLDLGGIAKGWAADVALERYCGDFENALLDVGGDIRARGGSRPGEPWAIGIGHPWEADGANPDRYASVLTLGQGGLATSGATQRWWYRAGERQHHLLDPRTGRPAQVWIDAADARPGEPPLIATATALAPTAAHAEIAAKVALLRGYPQALGAVEAAWKTHYAAALASLDEAGSWTTVGIGVADALAGTLPRADEEPPPYGDAPVALLLVLGDGAVACSTNMLDYLATFGGGGDLWLE